MKRSKFRTNEGSGIGLGGTIEVKSKINEGSEFIFEIPCRLVPNEDNSKNPGAKQAMQKGSI